jgi:hypothetical protein
MSVIRAGDIRQLTIDGREYDVAPDTSCNVKPGGFKNEVSRNGNGTLHNKQSRTMAGIDAITISVDDTRQDLEGLQEVADTGLAVPVTMTLASGMGYSGSLVLVAEDLGKSTGDGTVEISLLGETFEQI